MSPHGVAARDRAGRAPGSAGSYLVGQFREFYNELSGLADLARRFGGDAPPDAAPDPDYPDRKPEETGPPLPKSPFIAPEPPPLPGQKPLAPPLPKGADKNKRPPRRGDVTAAEAADRLQGLLETQALESGRRGGEYGVIYYRQAQYVMAVLADEIFLRTDWAGREAWKADLLETRLFGTYTAGDEFFKRLEKLLQDGERLRAELAVVYLLALSLGFRGKYRGDRHAGRIAEYRRQLYYAVYQRRPDLAEETRLICPEAYEHTAFEATPRMLPSPSRWYWVLGLTFVAFLVVGHVLWDRAVDPLRNTLERTFDAHRALLDGTGGE